MIDSLKTTKRFQKDVRVSVWSAPSICFVHFKVPCKLPRPGKTRRFCTLSATAVCLSEDFKVYIKYAYEQPLQGGQIRFAETVITMDIDNKTVCSL